MPRSVVILTHGDFYDRRTEVRFVSTKVSIPGSAHAVEFLGVAHGVPDAMVAKWYDDATKFYVVPEAPTAEVKAETAFDARIAETAEQLAPVAAAAVAEHRAAKKGHK